MDKDIKHIHDLLLQGSDTNFNLACNLLIALNEELPNDYFVKNYSVWKQAMFQQDPSPSRLQQFYTYFSESAFDSKFAKFIELFVKCISNPVTSDGIGFTLGMKRINDSFQGSKIFTKSDIDLSSISANSVMQVKPIFFFYCFVSIDSVVIHLDLDNPIEQEVTDILQILSYSALIERLIIKVYGTRFPLSKDCTEDIIKIRATKKIELQLGRSDRKFAVNEEDIQPLIASLAEKETDKFVLNNYSSIEHFQLPKINCLSKYLWIQGFSINPKNIKTFNIGYLNKPTFENLLMTSCKLVSTDFTHLYCTNLSIGAQLVNHNIIYAIGGTISINDTFCVDMEDSYHNHKGFVLDASFRRLHCYKSALSGIHTYEAVIDDIQLYDNQVCLDVAGLSKSHIKTITGQVHHFQKLSDYGSLTRISNIASSLTFTPSE